MKIINYLIRIIIISQGINNCIINYKDIIFGIRTFSLLEYIFLNRQITKKREKNYINLNLNCNSVTNKFKKQKKKNNRINKKLFPANYWLFVSY